MKITIVGVGYVGLVSAACLAEKKHDITCIDINEEKINMLNSGKMPIYEQGLKKLINKNIKRIKFTTSKYTAFNNAKVVMVCVPTPDEDGYANLKMLYGAINDIISNITNDCLVVIKSTVPVGECSKVQEYINYNINKDIKVEVASNPEFLSQGSAIKDNLNASRIIIGTNSKEAENTLKEIYKDYKNSKIITTDLQSAEMIKYASNDFLALKISYVNEIANLCENVNANVDDVVLGMGADDRIGKKFLKSGIGYGGSCFPKDTKALHWLANIENVELKTIKATIEVNEKQKLRLLEKTKKYYNKLDGLTVSVLGVTFKPGTDDLRDAPSIENIYKLLNKGVSKIKVWDKVAQEKIMNKYPNVYCCENIEQALLNSDICYIFTEWDDIKNFDINKFYMLMDVPIILDGRNCYNVKDIKDSKIIYDSIGRKTISNYDLKNSKKYNQILKSFENK